MKVYKRLYEFILFKNMNTRTLSIKRINNDLKEITNCPLEGIGIAPLDNDPMNYVVNIQLMTGIYEGYCIQLVLSFSDNYPTNPPKMLIFPGQPFDGKYHHHIYLDHKRFCKSDNDYFKGFCFDFLENNYMSISEEHSGWNPSYTISSILLQVQNFLSNPDLPSNLLPNKDEIDYLLKSMDNYRSIFIIKDAKGEKKIVHTWKDPYPKMYFKNNKINENNNNNDVNFNCINNVAKAEESEINNRIKEIKDNLTCFMLKSNYIDNPEIFLGYPIVQNKDVLGKDKIEIYPIPELISYEAYQVQTQNIDMNKLNLYFDNRNEMNVLKSANNEFYNFWLPIYINKVHYEKNKSTILESLKIIKKENEFKPEQIFEILPILLNKMIIGMFSGKSYISSAFIQCYFHYVLIFKKLIKEYEDDFRKYMTKKIELITKNDYDINKKIIPDIGNFLIIMFYANEELVKPEEKKKMWNKLFEEFFTREMYWIFHGDEFKNNMKNLIIKNNDNDTKIIDQICFEKFEDDPDFKMSYLDIFNKELHKIGIFDDIINIISNDYNILYQYYNDKNYTKNMVRKRIKQNFKRLFNEVSQKNRNQLKDIINRNMNFSLFFEYELNKIKEDIYDSMKVECLLNDKNIKNKDEILKYAFESQRGNKLLIITFFAQKKIEEKDFLENLEKNYGVYLDIDNFVKEMKQKLKEITCYKELFKYIGSEFSQDKDELQLIIKGYERAKEKGYIREKNNKKEINNNIYIRVGNKMKRINQYGNNYTHRNSYGYHHNYDQYYY